MPAETERKAAGGVLVDELLRLRDELAQTRSGRQALRYIEDILTLMKDQGMTWDLARMYVESWTKG